MEYLVVATVLVLTLMLARLSGGQHARVMMPVVLVAVGLRLLVHVAVLRGELLTYGGDQYTYENFGEQVALLWRYDGISFAVDAFPGLKPVAVPANLFAVIIYLCDGRAPLACTSVIALIAVGLCLVIYRFAMLIGASAGAAYRLFLLTLFGPSFLLHTSDTFKDGINAFLVVACLYLGVSIAKRFSLAKAALLVLPLWTLWYVRPYMVFMCALPIVLGVVGLKRALSLRAVVLMSIALVVTLVALESGEGSGAVAAAQEQFEQGSSSTVRDANAEGGSGVTFDDGGKAWGALVPKLAYTLLSPFPWMGGSIALQLGKIETFIWYYLIYEVVRGFRWFWKNDRETLLLLLLFIGPATLAYATSMSNVGLMFRQRMPIVIVTSLLSAVVWTKMPRGSGAKTGSEPIPA